MQRHIAAKPQNPLLIKSVANHFSATDLVSNGFQSLKNLTLT